MDLINEKKNLSTWTEPPLSVSTVLTANKGRRFLSDKSMPSSEHYQHMLWLLPMGSAEVYLCKRVGGSPNWISKKSSRLALALCKSEMQVLLLQSLLTVFFPLVDTCKIICALYLELNFLPPYSGDEKSLADCHLPFWFDTKLLKHYQCIQAGNKYIQKDSALWRYKLYSGTSTVSKPVIWTSQKSYQVNNNNKSSRKLNKSVNFSYYFRLQFSSHMYSWILLKSQWQKCSTLNANILLPKDQGTYAWILTPYLHDKPTFYDNFIYICPQ